MFRRWSALGRLGRLTKKGLEFGAVNPADNGCSGATAGQRRRDIFPLVLSVNLADYEITEVPADCVDDALCYLHGIVCCLNRTYGISQLIIRLHA